MNKNFNIYILRYCYAKINKVFTGRAISISKKSYNLQLKRAKIDYLKFLFIEPKLIACFLILVSTVANADFNNIHENFECQEAQVIIKLPWSDCTKIHKLLEEKLSFSEQQIKKEKKIHEKYKQYYLKHNNRANFSMQFLEKKSETNAVETLISGFLKFCKDNFQTSNSKSNSLNYHIKKQQEQWFNDMQNENYKIYYRKKYKNDIIRNNFNA
ncbi:hypothetical protein RCA_02345 [Rickettsia canadensis str. CA410]|uniref:Uncharacterized protein n=1 Tax=Rickettsia canadensis str. CA410 TaxID=1105107 RepID=A0ABN4A985_RICCA|nr:hypothetical protein RCA_02345 [Rickettsia canadensis str. CA410]